MVKRLIILTLYIAGFCAAAQEIAIVNGTVITAGENGTVENATILIAEGKIVEVGEKVELPIGIEVIDASGKFITPGFIAADTTLGLTEINGRANANDDPSLTKTVTAGFDVRDAINPASSLFNIARLGGITRAIVSPQTNRSLGQPFTGQSAQLDLSDTESLWSRSPVAVVMDYKSFVKNVGRGSALPLINQHLANAAENAINNALAPKQDGANLVVLTTLFTDSVPLLIRADKAVDLKQVARLKAQWNLNIVIQGAAEGWMVANTLSEMNIPVILDTYSSLPLDFDKLLVRKDNAAILSKAGVKVIIRADKDGHFARNARVYAGMAVANGLSYDEALKGITLYPAQVFGLIGLGTITQGNIADLVIWSGDPLEPLSQIEKLFIGGNAKSLTSRHLLLRDRYL